VRQACNIFKRLKLGIGRVVYQTTLHISLADLLFADVYTLVHRSSSFVSDF